MSEPKPLNLKTGQVTAYTTHTTSVAKTSPKSNLTSLASLTFFTNTIQYNTIQYFYPSTNSVPEPKPIPENKTNAVLRNYLMLKMSENISPFDIILVSFLRKK